MKAGSFVNDFIGALILTAAVIVPILFYFYG